MIVCPAGHPPGVTEMPTARTDRRSVRREDGYLPLNAYGMLGDGHAGALVAADGAVDWFAAPRLDTAPLCAALLDPAEGGAITLAPTEPFAVTQRYVGSTAVLETTFSCGSGVVRVTDALALGARGPLPWTELARRVEAVTGQVRMGWQVRPGHRFGSGRPWVRHGDGVPVLEVGDLQVGVVADGVGEVVVGPAAIEAEFVARAGERGLLAVVVSAAEPLQLPGAAAVHGRLDGTVQAWNRWCEDLVYDGPHAESVYRSAVTLKALTLTSHEGIAAALTTSLPERIGGPRNFDYRFGWVRDASFALEAMARLHMTVEVHAALSWLLRAVRHTAPDVRSMFTLDGEPASAEMASLDWLPGYRHSLPVLLGNGAASQTQLGAYGDLMNAVWRHTEHGGVLDPGSGGMLAGVADRVCDHWRDQDAGLWELGTYAHYTSSKINCWVALDRALRLAESGQLTSPRTERWRAERDALHSWVDEHCWSQSKQSYTFHADTDELDAAVLLAARTGFLAGDDPRLTTTISAIRAELAAEGPLLYRYSGMGKEEGAFLVCTFWLIEALTHSGRRDEAATLLDQAVAYAGDTGLFSEEVDPGSGELLGNLPQALTHLGLISAATTVHAASSA